MASLNSEAIGRYAKTRKITPEDRKVRFESVSRDEDISRVHVRECTYAGDCAREISLHIARRCFRSPLRIILMTLSKFECVTRYSQTLREGRLTIIPRRENFAFTPRATPRIL